MPTRSGGSISQHGRGGRRRCVDDNANADWLSDDVGEDEAEFKVKAEGAARTEPRNVKVSHGRQLLGIGGISSDGAPRGRWYVLKKLSREAAQ